MTDVYNSRQKFRSSFAALGLTWLLSSLLQRRESDGTVIASQRDRPPTRVADKDGAAADSPTEIPPRGWWQVLKRTYDNLSNNRLMAVAAGVTFYGLLAIFPAIAAFVSLYGLFADASTINQHLNALSALLPGGAIEIVTGQVSRIASKGGGTLGVSFAIGLATSIWSANAGIKALFDALNVVYGRHETRSFLALNALSLTFTLGAIIFVGLAISAVTVVPIILQTVGLGDAAQLILWAARWPALLLVLILGLAALYRFGPDRNDAKWRWITPGSAIAAVVWLGFSMLFSWYVANFGNYNETYGTLGAVVGFMTWIWLSTVILLMGAAINAELEQQTDQDTSRGQTAKASAGKRETPEPLRA